MEVSYSTIRGSLEVVPALTQDPRDSGGSCFLVFDGVDLTEDVLRDWLRLCTTQVMAAPWELSTTRVGVVPFLYVCLHRRRRPRTTFHLKK